VANIKGQAICVASAKGGVGKTITTLNLAGIFEHLNKKVLIIDLDLSSGGISVSLNKPFDKTVYNFFDDYNNNRYKDFNDYITKYDDFIDFIPCPKDPRQANKIDSKYIELLIDKAIFLYDIVLIDTNHNLNEINIVTLDKVDIILFMLTNDPLDLKNMKSLLSIFKDANVNKYKIILNNSCDPYKNYFSLFDIKSIINANIDYSITSSFYIKNMDSYIMNGEIITLQKRMPTLFNKDYSTFMTIALDILNEVKKEGEERGKE
jgi:pilus assembly protein CpaE